MVSQNAAAQFYAIMIWSDFWVILSKYSIFTGIVFRQWNCYKVKLTVMELSLWHMFHIL